MRKSVREKGKALAVAVWLILNMSVAPMPAGADEPEGRPWPPKFVHSKVATTMGGWHATTQTTIRLVFPRKDGWLVFHASVVTRKGDPSCRK